MEKAWKVLETDYTLRAMKALKEKDYLTVEYTTEYLVELQRLIKQNMNVEELELEVLKLTVEIERISTLMESKDGAEWMELYDFRGAKSNRRYLIKDALIRNKYSL